MPHSLAEQWLAQSNATGLLLMEVGQYLEAQAEKLQKQEAAQTVDDPAALLAAWRRRHQSEE